MIVAGFGFRGAATPGALQAALALWVEKPDVLTTARDKAATPCFQEFATTLGLPVVVPDDAALRAQMTLSQSAASLEARGLGSLAEAAALAVAGPGSTLLAERRISPDRLATCALAQIEEKP